MERHYLTMRYIIKAVDRPVGAPEHCISAYFTVNVGSIRDREVTCSASDRQGSTFDSCAWRTVPSHSSHHPQEVLLAQFSLYVHKGGIKPNSFHFIYFTVNTVILDAFHHTIFFTYLSFWQYPATKISPEWQTQKYQILVVVRLCWEMSWSVKWIDM